MFFKIINFMDHSYARNVSFAFIIGVFCVVLGSLSTALFVAASVAVIFINPKISFNNICKETLALLKNVPGLSIFPLFYLVVVLTSLQGDSWWYDALFVAGSYWQLLIMLPVSVGLFHLSKDINFAGLFSYGCRVGLLFVVPLSLIQIYFLNLRPEGIFSNALIFASLCIAGAGLAIIEWPEDNQKTRTLSWIVFVAGIVAALLTFSRGMLLPIAGIILIAIWYRYKGKTKYQPKLKTVIILGAVTIATFAASLQTDNGWRILNKRILQPIEMFVEGKPFDRSISQRLDMQVTGFHAFLEAPFIGHGIQNSVEQANSVSEQVLNRKTDYTYTHLHNDYLTHAVGGGIILFVLFVAVIFSPFFMVWQLAKEQKDPGLFYYGLMLTGAFSTISMTNLVFRNDQLTTMFCVATIFIIIRYVQKMHNINEARIPDLPTIANGINPIGLVSDKGAISK